MLLGKVGEKRLIQAGRYEYYKGWTEEKCNVRTKGGVRYSKPILLAFRVVEMTSFIKLYLSILKLSVGPSDNLTIRKDGATDVKVKASM